MSIDPTPSAQQPDDGQVGQAPESARSDARRRRAQERELRDLIRRFGRGE